MSTFSLSQSFVRFFSLQLDTHHRGAWDPGTALNVNVTPFETQESVPKIATKVARISNVLSYRVGFTWRPGWFVQWSFLLRFFPLWITEQSGNRRVLFVEVNHVILAIFERFAFFRSVQNLNKKHEKNSAKRCRWECNGTQFFGSL